MKNTYPTVCPVCTHTLCVPGVVPTIFNDDINVPGLLGSGVIVGSLVVRPSSTCPGFITGLKYTGLNQFKVEILKVFYEKKEEFEDTKGVIRIRKSRKNRQHNGQRKKDKQRST